MTKILEHFEAMNFNKLEIARCAKAYSENIEYVSFYFPKRNEGYDQSLRV